MAVEQQREFAVNFIDRKSGDMRLSIRVRQTPLARFPWAVVLDNGIRQRAEHLFE